MQTFIMYVALNSMLTFMSKVIAEKNTMIRKKKRKNI
jgi:hypothetical protein